MVIKLTVSAWGVAFVLVAILLGMTIRLNRCRTLITNPYCDNPSIFKLSCENVYANNVYGLTFTVVLLTASIGSPHLFQNHSSMFDHGFVLIILHRFPQYPEYRKTGAIMFHIVPGSLNPLIYGLQSKEIHKCLSNIFHFKRVKPSI
ncbi:hypothetical protein JOQ06_023043 [Pogonophryne albipinna]|uniref:G-protein coupled receptors family 1 profile domain-containing protein n=1 Tax=Pogonophryne albipinna TaxID=1090488 RepID=A0AAD6A8M0_9TELE|nr:hypothetical protein JOQ06_023043 [Pogonophryne albipinna]